MWRAGCTGPAGSDFTCNLTAEPQHYHTGCDRVPLYVEAAHLNKADVNQVCPPMCQVGVKVPLIVRLEGTNVERGKEILRDSDVEVITADDLDDAAMKAVASLS